MADETLSDAIDWKTYEVAAGLASGHVPVRIGTVGNGSPVGVLIARIEAPGKVVAVAADVTEAAQS